MLARVQITLMRYVSHSINLVIFMMDFFSDNQEASYSQAGKFRMFWGEKAELRRFKDGTINETAGW